MRATHRTLHRDDPKAHFELCELPNCVYLTVKGGCGRLNLARCSGEGCAFFQTDREREESQEKWRERLERLDRQEQEKIARKYYGGAMPWKECGQGGKANVPCE